MTFRVGIISSIKGYRNENGFALLITISFVAVISLILIGILSQSIQHAHFSKYYQSNIKAHYLAEAGINRLIDALLNPRDDLLKDYTSQEKISWPFHGKNIILKIESESGKVDLNYGHLRHIKNLVKFVFSNKEDADVFTAWVEKKRLNNNIIVGIPLPIFNIINSHSIELNTVFTVHSKQTTIDPYSASKKVLHSVPSLPSNLPKSNSKFAFIKQNLLSRDQFKAFLGRKLPIYRLIASVPVGAGRAYHYSVIIRISADNKSVRILEEKQLII